MRRIAKSASALGDDGACSAMDAVSGKLAPLAPDDAWAVDRPDAIALRFESARDVLALNVHRAPSVGRITRVDTGEPTVVLCLAVPTVPEHRANQVGTFRTVARGLHCHPPMSRSKARTRRYG